MTPSQQLFIAREWLAQACPAYVVEVEQVRGSTPRESGARMLVSLQDVIGTIGGGHLEWQAVTMARQALAECAQHHRPLTAWSHDFALGPSLGQCCGGALRLSFQPVDAALLEAWALRLPQPRFHLELHGAGHVGQAIIHILRDIDCTVRWIDERDPPSRQHESDHHSRQNTSTIGLPSPDTLVSLPDHITWCPTDDAEAEVAVAPPNACHLVLTHRHDLDLRLVHAILKQGGASFVGMIGSQTKRAQFRKRLAERGLAEAVVNQLHCPIGLPTIEGKEPGVIAVSVVAQLLSSQPRPTQ